MENSCVCSLCGVNKTRIRDGVDRGQAKFIDENGRKWERRKCPDCYRVWYRDYQKARNLAAKKGIKKKKPWGGRELVYISAGTKTRPCRECGTSTINYYYCKSCLARKSTSESDFMILHGSV